MEHLVEILKKASDMRASDLFIMPGAVITVKVENDLASVTDKRLNAEETRHLIEEIYTLAGRSTNRLEKEGDDDFSFAIANVSRFRCNAYRQRGSLAATCRIVKFGLPDPAELHIPEIVLNLAENRSGMILVTGPAGCGKSTTLACIIDRINTIHSGHIVTIEDPIEYLHTHRKSLVSQREVSNDAMTFSSALRAALRQAPDVVMLGEMRDVETIHAAITAAETGHLLLSSLHTVGAAKTIDRILDSFQAQQQAHIRIQLSMVLKTVVSQRLVPTVDGRRWPVFEVMLVNPAISTMIRDGRTHQIDNIIYGENGKTMLSMDSELQRCCREGLISRNTAIMYASNPEIMGKKL